MKIAVVSDTHGNWQLIEKALQEEPVDYLMFLGDNAEDGRQLERSLGIPAFIVQGNCDYSDPAPVERMVELGGWQFLLCHGHSCFVKENLTWLWAEARDRKVDFALYGHTHQAFYEERDGITVINPGAVSMLDLVIGTASWGLLTLSDKKDENFFKKYEKKACQKS